MSQTKEKDSIFRLATMLYKDKNYNSSRDNTIRKIVESVFLEDNSKKTIFEIIEICEENYKLALDENEINNIVCNNPENFLIKREDLSNINKICLTDKRINKLRINKATDIEKYIDKYIDIEIDENQKDKAKDIIYKFLYQTFSSNLSIYQYYLNLNETDYNININYKDFIEEDKRIINGFLKFDDVEKDKAIFDIVSFSLEYCILTGNSKQVYIEGIKNKIFYLDSNIIYRAIGINGEARRKLTYKFLHKCKKANIDFVISRYAEEEFKGSIEHNINKITKYTSDGQNFNGSIFDNYKCGHDIYSFYYEWCSTRSNREIKLFEAHINSLYEDLKDEFNIKVDYKKYFNDDDEELNKIITSINNLKNYSGEYKPDIIVEYDAKLILTMKRIRQNTSETRKKFSMIEMIFEWKKAVFLGLI